MERYLWRSTIVGAPEFGRWQVAAMIPIWAKEALEDDKIEAVARRFGDGSATEWMPERRAKNRRESDKPPELVEKHACADPSCTICRTSAELHASREKEEDFLEEREDERPYRCDCREGAGSNHFKGGPGCKHEGFMG